MLQLTENTIVHLDTPTAATQLTQIPIQGWIISHSPIHNIAVSSKNTYNLQLVERPDVAAAYPNYPYVQGFIDIIPSAWLTDQNLSLIFTLDQQAIVQIFTLPPAEAADVAIHLNFLKQVNNQLYHLDVAQQCTQMRATPPSINIEITNRCNLSCPTCARNYWDNAKNPIGDTPLELVETLRPYLERASFVSLLGYGEAVLSPNFKQILWFVRQFNPRMAMFNNGTTLSPKTVDMILDAEIHGLIISLDGATEAMIQHTRTASLKTILRNVNQLRQRSVERNLPAPRLSVSFTASRVNIDELPALVDLAAQHGFTEIFVGLAKVFSTMLVPESLFLHREHALQRFEQAVARGKELGVVVQVPNFNQEQGCHQPFELFTVKWNGSVRLCCNTITESNLLQPIDNAINLATSHLNALLNTKYIIEQQGAATCMDWLIGFA